MFNLSRFRFLARGFSTVQRSKVFMDIAVEGEPKGRLIFELFDDLTPKTAENFRKLCVGAGRAKSKDVHLHYKGTSFYRIFEGFMCQGGDVINNDGTGGESIYGPTFHDENKKVQLDKPGVLAMLNKGPDTNNSNFFITFIDCSFLDDKYVGFGQLIDGHPVLNQIEYCGNAAKKGEPKKKVEIINCGEIKTSAAATNTETNTQ